MKFLFHILSLILAFPCLLEAQKDTIHLPPFQVFSEGIRGQTYELSLQGMRIHQPSLLPVLDLNKSIQIAPNTDVRTRGKEGVQADITIRNGSSDQSLILLNGIQMNDPQTGHHSMNLPLSVENVASMEIVNVSNASIYGVNAFSGAINIQTPSPLKDQVFFSLYGGDFHLLSKSLAVATHYKHWGVYLAFNQKNCDGYTQNTDFETRQLYFRSKYAGNRLKIDIQGGETVKSFGAENFYTATYPDQYETIKMRFVSGIISGGKHDNISLKLYVRNHLDKFQLFRNSAPSWYKSHNYHQTWVSGGDLGYKGNWFGGLTHFGINYRNETIYSNVLGDLLTTPVPVEGELNASYTRYKNRSDAGIYLEHILHLPLFDLQFNLLGNVFSHHSPALFPGISIRTSLNPNIDINLQFSKSFRLPSYTDLYYSGPTLVGNSHLLPEESKTLEMNALFHQSIFEGKFCLFQRWGSQLIDWVKKPGEARWTTVNYTAVNVWGIEFAAVWRFKGKLIHNLEITYANNQVEKVNTPDYISYYVLDGIRQKLGFQLQHRLFGKLNMSWMLYFQERNGTYIQANTGKQQAYKPYLTEDVKLSYPLDAFLFFIEIDNLSNQEYHDFGNILMPGRWIKGGVNLNVPF